MRRSRLALALGLLLAALLLAACGDTGSAGEAETDGSPEQVAAQFFAAIADANGAAACRLSTTKAQIAFGNGDDCVAVVIKVLGPTAADRAEFEGASFVTTKETAKRATVEATLADGSEQTLELELVDGEWRIAAG